TSARARRRRCGILAAPLAKRSFAGPPAHGVFSRRLEDKGAQLDRGPVRCDAAGRSPDRPTGRGHGRQDPRYLDEFSGAVARPPPRPGFDHPAERIDFVIPSYELDATVTDSAELLVLAKATVLPRYSGEKALIFSLDSNLRVSAIKDGQGFPLAFYQARERKE